MMSVTQRDATSTTPGASEGALELHRTFEASPARVWEAFTDPRLLARWAAPGEHRVESAEVDLRVGGRYVRVMRFPDGSRHRLVCVFREIVPPARLAYTFRWETLPGFPETLVTIDFAPSGSQTTVRIRHTGLDDPEMARDYEVGWASTLDKLAGLLAS